MRLLLALIGATLVALVTVASAAAHASLVETTPAARSIVDRSPGQVVLRFDEAVSTVAGSVRVFDSEVHRVDLGSVTKPGTDTVATGLPARLPDGTYTVAWRVISEDSHPIRGAFVFAVRERGERPEGVAKEVLDSDAGSSAVDSALWVVRFAGFVAMILLIGAAAILGFVARATDRVRVLWWLVAGLGASIAASSVGLIMLTGLDAASFGLDAVFRWSPASDVLHTDFGRVWLARAGLGIALVVVAALALRKRGGEAVLMALMVLAGCVAVTPALSGHARVEGAAAVVSDSAHVAAAGIWVGGLACLALLLVTAGSGRWTVAAATVPRFSQIAVVAVAVIVASGAVSGFLEVRSWSALWETTYGRLLLVKVALVVPLVTLGVFQNRVSVPRLRSRTGDRVARHRFALVVVAELALMTGVIAVTTFLVAEPPAKSRLAAAAGPVSRDGQIGPYGFTVTVDPARVGTNQIHLYLLDSTGQLADVDEVALAATLPSVAVGPLVFQTTKAGPGHRVVPAAELPLPGVWQLQLDVREGEFSSWSASVDIPIRKDN